MKYFIFINSVLIILGLSNLNCFKREHKNPIDPNTPDEIIDTHISILSFDKRVELEWGKPDMQNLTAFRLYRKAEYDSGFILVDELSPAQHHYSDTTVTYNTRYSYNLTLIGGANESNPSKTVSIIPGPGYNWILDRGGYQLIKTTYDAEHVIKIYDRDWPPSDMAIDPESGIVVIVHAIGSLIEKLDTKNNVRLEAYNDATRPYAVVYDSTGQCFWMVDTTGSLIKTGLNESGFQIIDSTLKKPVWLSVAENSGMIHVVDRGNNSIIQYNRDGEITDKISIINDKRLMGPEKYLIDERYNRIWLVDHTNQKDILYSKYIDDFLYSKIDSFENIGDICLSPKDESLYTVNMNEQNSQVMQLFPSGNRQLVVGNLYYPFSIAVSPYDESILIADTYNSQVKHYDYEQKIIGTLQNLVSPLKVFIE
jgi:DNA-binding beta-propeller fold protein YncE